MNSKIILTTGREIVATSFFAHNLAADLSSGIADRILVRHAMETANRIWPQTPCVVVDPTPSSSNGSLSVQFVCAAEFVSHRSLPDSSELASSLVIIWFQSAMTNEMEEKALMNLREIDWDKSAIGFSW